VNSASFDGSRDEHRAQIDRVERKRQKKERKKQKKEKKRKRREVAVDEEQDVSEQAADTKMEVDAQAD
jgi:hypothetical protein